MKKIKIDRRLLGEGEPCFIVAEAGLNHNGDINLAKKLIDAVKSAGSDAVKFQAFKTERVVTKYAEKARYQKETTGSNKSQYNMIRRLELKDEEFVELYNYAKKNNIIFLSSAFDKESVDLLDNLGVPAFKVASGEITNFPLLQFIAEKKKPIILSTGMSTIGEIEEALEVIREKGVEDIVLLHCVTSYPAKIEDANLRVIEALRRKFKLPVGFSDHTLGITIPIAAVALGAVLVEKHFTLDRTLPGPDHRASLEPDELKDMVKAIRDVEKALGDGIKKPTKDEERIKKVVRRSIVAKMEIPKGTVITEDMLDLKRPAVGIEPKYLNEIIGKRAKKNIKPDELITFDKLVW
jgi:N-acetylneuraminate synthase/N,N'-diacetyllegionaminate synthase